MELKTAQSCRKKTLGTWILNTPWPFCGYKSGHWEENEKFISNLFFQYIKILLGIIKKKVLHNWNGCTIILSILMLDYDQNLNAWFRISFWKVEAPQLISPFSHLNLFFFTHLLKGARYLNCFAPISISAILILQVHNWSFVRSFFSFGERIGGWLGLLVLGREW